MVVARAAAATTRRHMVGQAVTEAVGREVAVGLATAGVVPPPMRRRAVGREMLVGRSMAEGREVAVAAVLVPFPMRSRAVGRAVAVTVGVVSHPLRGRAMAVAGRGMTWFDVVGGKRWRASAYRRCLRCRFRRVLGCGEFPTGTANPLTAPNLRRRTSGDRRERGLKAAPVRARGGRGGP